MPKNSSADSDSANLGMSRTTGMSRSFARPKIVGGFAVPTTSSKSHSASSVPVFSSIHCSPLPQNRIALPFVVD